ncbi:unnamed protein product [Adineta steineri]|uniref:Ephrin RBD domain-containing protein n=2 Tax=Adineta steineri TaxID=433720 RepID=A0A815CLK8_9BILA|nr:unnamed protein product [Adineta steineri]CAF3927697.1 unnamed protein product [Adineta steineri]
MDMWPYQDVSLIFEVRLGDVMDLICPFYDEHESYMLNEFEQYDIYRVAKSEYDMCTIDQLNTDPMTRALITCNSPYDVMKYTLNFRSYLPIPNGLEFHSNQTYYFLSTSLSHQPCYKLKIIVHDYQRIIPSTSTASPSNEQDQNFLISSYYSNSRHELPTIDKNTNYNDNHQLFSHVMKAQRHSDPYSIKWITDGPHHLRNSDKSYRTTDSTSSSNALSLALNSLSLKISPPYITILLIVLFSLI